MADKTVSKTTDTVAPVAPTEQAIAEGTAPRRKTVTNWQLLEDGGFIPVRVRCDGYKGNHPADLSCHSNLQPTGENVLRHMANEHGGGWFKVRFRLSDGKKSPLWGELQEAGVEMQEFYCPHCREQVPMTQRAIIQHLQPHAGANRVNLEPQTLCMTLSFTREQVDEYDDLYMHERA